MSTVNYIRNFSIISHIDHGKTKLSESIVSLVCKLGDINLHKDVKVFDSLDTERRRGITIKMHYIRMRYGKYTLNLIDTPGHSDFSFEIYRSLNISEGVILLIDASKGAQAQTIYNKKIADDLNLKIIPVISKVDLKDLNLDKVYSDFKLLGFEKNEILHVSSKLEVGVDKLITQVISQIPYPKVPIHLKNKTVAKVFNVQFDSYCGLLLHVKVLSGVIRVNDILTVYFKKNLNDYKFVVTNVGFFDLLNEKTDQLNPGELGHLKVKFQNKNILNDVDVNVNGSLIINPTEDYSEGDLIELSYNLDNSSKKSSVYYNIYPVDKKQLEHLKNCLYKIKVRDPAISIEQVVCSSGFSLKCGFLGTLHFEIIREQLKKEFDLEIYASHPSLLYKVITTKGAFYVVNRDDLKKIPYPIVEYQEPIADIEIKVDSSYLGKVIVLITERRFISYNIIYPNYIDSTLVKLKALIPMVEVISDFENKLKSVSGGFASVKYSFLEYVKADLQDFYVKVNDVEIPELSSIIHKSYVIKKARSLCDDLKKNIPRKLFNIKLQFYSNCRVILRDNIKPFRKNVIEKCYGGDVSRKKKLIEKQRAGKKKLSLIESSDTNNKSFFNDQSILNNIIFKK
jgi:GTP-binding protein LepA